MRDLGRVPIEAQGQLGEVIAADGEAVEVLEKVLCQQDVGREFAHHHDLEVIDASFKPMFRQ